MKAGGARVAVVGATGLVGQEIVSLLAEREFPIRELLLYASERTAGSEVAFGEDGVRVGRVPRELPQVDIAFVCARADVEGELAEDFAAAGAAVIELSARRGSRRPPLALAGWRDPDVGALAEGGIVAVPDPLAQLLAVPLRAIAGIVPIDRVLATALVSASMFGRRGVEWLSGETVALLNGQAYDEAEERRVSAFSCVPEDGDASSFGVDIAEQVVELLGAAVPVAVSVVHTPTFYGHGASVWAELGEDAAIDRFAAALREAPSVLWNESGAAAPGTLEAVGSDGIHVAALRIASNDPRWVHFWAAADSVRQGAALAAVAIAEAILRRRAA